jgi:hypothetical protein
MGAITGNGRYASVGVALSTILEKLPPDSITS